MFAVASLSALASISNLVAGGGSLAIAILGIAFLIFIHEAGHFLAAKWCGVKVEVFSIGFGKRLFGFERGDTDYRVSLIPLGGYVQMLGQDDADPNQPRTDREDDFRNKSPGQRALILIGGVAVNSAFAVIGFILAYWLGVSAIAPHVGSVRVNSPAAGKLQPGDHIVAIDGEKVLSFDDIPQNVATSSGAEMLFKVRRIGADNKPQVLEFKITPTRPASADLFKIGVSFLTVVGDLDQNTATFKEGLRPGDRITAFYSDQNQRVPVNSWVEFQSYVDSHPGGSVKVEVFRDQLDKLGNPDGPSQRFEFKLPIGKKNHYTVGLQFNDAVRIGDVLPNSSASKGGLKKGDLLVSLDGAHLTIDNHVDVIQAQCKKALAAKAKTLDAVVKRGEAGKAPVELTLKLPVPEFSELDKKFYLGILSGADLISAVASDSPLAKINAERTKNKQPIVEAGDRLLSISTRKKLFVFWTDTQPGFKAVVQDSLDGLAGKPCQLTFQKAKSGEVFSIVVAGVLNKAHTTGEVEFSLNIRQSIVKLPFGEAIAVGIDQTRQQATRIFRMLKSLTARQVSVKKLGGPLAIIGMGSKVALEGLGKLLWFLAMISVNLAVLNILPIPVLDGGHLVFVVIEWLKGEPVSEDVMIYAQWGGMIAILGLILIVTFNDVLRLWAGL